MTIRALGLLLRRVAALRLLLRLCRRPRAATSLLFLRRVVALRLLLRLRRRALAGSLLLLHLVNKGGRDPPPLRLLRRVVVLLLRLVSKERRQPQPLRLLWRRLVVQLPEAGGNIDSVLL